MLIRSDACLKVLPRMHVFYSLSHEDSVHEKQVSIAGHDAQNHSDAWQRGVVVSSVHTEETMTSGQGKKRIVPSHHLAAHEHLSGTMCQPGTPCRTPPALFGAAPCKLRTRASSWP